MNIPKNLDEAIDDLINLAKKEDLEAFRDCIEDSATTQLHHGFGTTIRNNWGLWQENALTKYFNSIGVFHADDMSGIIFTSLHRKLNGKDIDVEGQIKLYKYHWDSMGCDMSGNPIRNKLCT